MNVWMELLSYPDFSGRENNVELSLIEQSEGSGFQSEEDKNL